MTSDSLSQDSPSNAPRRVICLTGPSVPVDASRHAVRRDLAELDLAPIVFAQHYAVPMASSANRAVPIHVAPRADSDVVATLGIGDAFYVLDIGKDWAWGRGIAGPTVGYVSADALTLP